MSVLICLTTCPDRACAERLAATLVRERLAACVNILPGLRSTYLWQDRLEQADEVLLLVKTTAERYPALQARLPALHGLAPADPSERDLVLGNIKARQRMVAQFALAGSLRGLVIGTDHAAEAVMGFFTKFGDGAADLLPLAGLNKRRVRAIASYLGAPAKLIGKVPTADLDDGAPLRPDEDVYGVTYDQIDDFLEGKAVTQSVAGTIASAYRATAHKRTLPVAHSSRSGRQER